MQYHTQIVLMMYEDTTLLETDPNRFRVCINFSPGTAACQRKVNERLCAMSGVLLCAMLGVLICAANRKWLKLKACSRNNDHRSHGSVGKFTKTYAAIHFCYTNICFSHYCVMQRALINL